MSRNSSKRRKSRNNKQHQHKNSNTVKTIQTIDDARTGGQNALRGYSYQLLYSCYILIKNANENNYFRLEGIEDIDHVEQINEDTYYHIQLKYSINKQDASFLKDVLKNILEVYLIDKNRNFKLVYDFPVAHGFLSAIFDSNLNSKSQEYWENVILNIKRDNINWNWELYDFDEFMTHITFEKKEKLTLINDIEKALIEKYDITTDNISLFANGLKVFCLEKMENRENIYKEDIDKLIYLIKDDISKGYQNPAHKWIQRIDYSISNLKNDNSFFEGKKATPSDIANGMPIRRIHLEKDIEESIKENTITIIKSSSGQGKTTLALQTAYTLSNEYSPYQLIWCNKIEEINDIVCYFKTRIKLGEKPLILIDNLDSRTKNWNSFVQSLQNEIPSNYKVMITTREMDWYNYCGDLSNIHSIKIIKPALDEKEAKEIYNKFLEAKRIHENVKSWKEAWNKIANRKLLIEYVYLLTHGEMLSERITDQIKKINKTPFGNIKCDILRKVCFADVCGTRLSLFKLYETPLENNVADLGELLKSMNDEFLIKESDGYIEGLHPVRSMHIVEALHEFYPIDITALAVIKMIDKESYLELFSHLEEFDFNSKDFFRSVVDTLYDQEDFSSYILAIKGLFSGGVLKYFKDNKSLFDKAQEHRGGLFIISTELCPFTDFNEFKVYTDTLEELKEINPDSENINYLCGLLDEFPKYNLKYTYVYKFSEFLYYKMQKLHFDTNIDFEGYSSVIEWLYIIDSKFNLSLNYSMEYVWKNIDKLSFESFTKYMFTFYLGNKKEYKIFLKNNFDDILFYIKHSTNSHKIYIDKESNAIHIEYILSYSNISNANNESVSRIKLLCKALPIFDTYCADSIKPAINILNNYTMPKDSHKEMPIRNVIIMFHQEINQLWNNTILRNYEFATVDEWVEYWESVRTIICDCMDKGCVLIDKKLGNKNITTAIKEYNQLYSKYYTLLINEKSYPKIYKITTEIYTPSSEFSKIKNDYFNLIENILGSFGNLLSREENTIRMFLLNLRKIQNTYLVMQEYFKRGNLISNQEKHSKLCLRERKSINNFIMYCHYYNSHTLNKNYNKYDIKIWYEESLLRDNLDAQEKLERLEERYIVTYPNRAYFKDYLSCYPIIIKNLDLSSNEDMGDFIERSMQFVNTLYDYLILLVVDENNRLLPTAYRFSKEMYKKISDNEEITNLPFPEEITSQMLECFDKKYEINQNTNKIDYSPISYLAEKLWHYSKLERILTDKKDEDYLLENLKNLKNNNDKLLEESKEIISSDFYNSLYSICEKVYNGEEFNDSSFNEIIDGIIIEQNN